MIFNQIQVALSALEIIEKGGIFGILIGVIAFLVQHGRRLSAESREANEQRLQFLTKWAEKTEEENNRLIEKLSEVVQNSVAANAEQTKVLKEILALQKDTLDRMEALNKRVGI